jgi:hypothetical protein
VVTFPSDKRFGFVDVGFTWLEGARAVGRVWDVPTIFGKITMVALQIIQH